MDDISTLAEHNTRFIQACRQGSWEVLEPLLTRACSYLDGVSGKTYQRRGDDWLCLHACIWPLLGC